MTLKEQQTHFKELTKLMEHTLFSKGDDYANADRLSNFKLSGAISGTDAKQIALDLIAVKVSRLGNLFHSEKVNNESISDSILDLANYSILLHMIVNEGLHSQESKHVCYESSQFTCNCKILCERNPSNL
jgi:hypothetical protein